MADKPESGPLHKVRRGGERGEGGRGGGREGGVEGKREGEGGWRVGEGDRERERSYDRTRRASNPWTAVLSLLAPSAGNTHNSSDMPDCLCLHTIPAE